MSHALVWMDIPVQDLDRAIAFYQQVLDRPVAKESFDGGALGVVRHGDDEVAFCLVHNGHAANVSGPLPYLNVDGRLDEAVAQVERLGGKVLEERHALGPFGWRAIIRDSEGNRLALHSN
ncbi:VOC family protein [Gallaecimonas sp. GXIMD4217]|uniref:VOC family protein n=1 Tax=Gallaecimonas sp. GXIMD4217 TaxID=3131927 RepID=UPI00311B2CE1